MDTLKNKIQTPVVHYALVRQFRIMDDAYLQVHGHMTNPARSDMGGEYHRVLAKGLVNVIGDDEGIGKSDFGWYVVSVQLGPGPKGDEVYLLTWTDHVANDWGEWFDTDHEAFARLASLTRAVYNDTQMEDLDEFHYQYTAARAG